MNSRETETHILPSDHITKTQILQMFTLHCHYFDNVSFEKFEHDFNKKQWCIVIFNKESEVVGYSTIELSEITFNNSPILILFSGDTLVAKEYRCSNALMPRFIQFTEYLQRQYPSHIRYWLLITKGYRTYRLIPVNYKTFYPTYRWNTPQEIKILMETLCKRMFGSRFDPITGILKSNFQNDFLKPEFATIPHERATNKDVRFFLDANPEFAKGDELVCLTPLETSNLNPFIFRKYMREKWNPGSDIQ
jgi:hypothetical protein